MRIDLAIQFKFIQKKEGRLTTPTTTPTTPFLLPITSHTHSRIQQGATMENRRLQQMIIPADYFQPQWMFWNGRALRALQTQLKSLREEPLEGFRLIIDENNLFEWTVGIYGPPDSLYQGGYFKAEINFPMFFPDRPPVMIFTPPIYHPNIYPDGRVCISFLHPPGNDPLSGERADQRWNKDRDMRQILLAVVALLSEPNPDSPANIDAAVSYRRYKQTGCADYLNRIKLDVEKSKLVAIEDNVTVPLTREEYLATGAAGGSKNNAPAEKEEPANKKKKQPAKNPDEVESLPDSSSSDDSDEDGPSTSQQQQNDDDDEELQSISSFSL